MSWAGRSARLALPALLLLSVLPSAPPAAGQDGPSLGALLVVSEWELTELDGERFGGGAGIDVTFWPSGRVSGSSGCNVYESTWSWSPPGRLSFGSIATSRRTCRPAIAKREARYVEMLRSVEGFEPTADGLTLTTVPGATLVFRRGTQAPGVLMGRWSLTALDGVKVAEGIDIGATFDESGTIAGTSGCNAYSAPYVLDDEAIRTGRVTAELASCPDDVMRSEDAFLRALEAATAWSVRGYRLMLIGPRGEPSLEFVVVRPIVLRSVSDAGWRLARFGDVDVPRTIGMTAVFTSAGTLTGSSGCNGFSATYRIDGTFLSIADLTTDTARTCAPEVMDNESAYLDALRGVIGYKIPENQLRLITASGTELLFDGTPSGETGPSEAQVLADAITGAVWGLVEASGTDVRSLAAVTLVLLADGTVSGVSGCDLYEASWAVEEGALRFRDAGSGGGRQCEDDVMALQGSYLMLLPFVDGARLEGGALVLTLPGSEDGLRFELRAPAP